MSPQRNESQIEGNASAQEQWAKYAAFEQIAWNNQPGGSAQDVSMANLGSLRAGGSSLFDSAKNDNKGFGESGGVIGLMDDTTKKGWGQIEAWADHALAKAEGLIGKGIEGVGQAAVVGGAAAVSLLTPSSDMLKPVPSVAVSDMAPAAASKNPFAGIALPEGLSALGVSEDKAFNKEKTSSGFYELGGLVNTIGIHGTQISQQQWVRAA